MDIVASKVVDTFAKHNQDRAILSAHSRVSNKDDRIVKQVIVDENLLGEIVDRLVKAIDPDRIVLFGSRVRGDERSDSDLDLLVVKDSEDPPHRRVIPAYRALTGLGVSKDIIWRTPGEISDWAGVQNYVVTRALREGRVLYEKRA